MRHNGNPAPWMEGYPATIKVAAFDFAVEFFDSHAGAGEGRYGACSTIECKIRVQSDIATAVKTVDTTMHEIGHAIYWAYGIDDDDKEERIVSTLATAWTQVFRDNPELLAWMARALQSEGHNA